MDVMGGTKGSFGRLRARTVSKIRQPVSSQFETTIKKGPPRQEKTLAHGKSPKDIQTGQQSQLGGMI